MLTEPPVVVMLFKCKICGRPQAKDRPVCSPCYKAGKSIRGGKCPGCGKEHGVGNRNRVWCDDCREERLSERGKEYRARRKMAGIERYRMMKVAEKPLKGDDYALTHEPISDEELAVKREKYLSLLAADVHTGTYGHPTRWHPPEAEYGGFGALANQHMRGGEAGQGLDRGARTVGSMAQRENRRTQDMGEFVVRTPALHRIPSR